MTDIVSPHIRQSERRQFYGYLAGLIILFPFTILLVALRIHVRKCITATFNWEDWILLFALATIILAGFVWLPIIAQLGYSDGVLANISNGLYLSYLIAASLYVTAGVFVKVCIAAFFYRVARATWQRWVLVAPLIAFLISMSISFVVLVLRCGPGASATRILTGTNCAVSTSSFAPLTTNSATLNVISDLAFSLIPIHMLMTAQHMDRKTKSSSFVIIFLALVASAVSIARVPFFAKAKFGPDFLYQTGALSFLSILENCVAIGSISLVTLKPLLIKHFPNASIHQRTQNSQQQNTKPASKKDWLWAATSRIMPRRQGGRGRLGVLPDTTINNTMMMMTVDQEGGGRYVGLSFGAPPPNIAEVLEKDGHW